MGGSYGRVLRVPRKAGNSFKSMTTLLTSGDGHAALDALRRHVGPSINSPRQMGMALIHLASEVGSTDLVQLLLLLDADINLKMARKYGCWTPLMFAASNGHEACCRLLLQQGADPHLTDIWGNTPILKAASYGFADCVKVLLEFCADPQRPNRWQTLPLQIASRQGHHDVVTVLLVGGCDPNLIGDLREPSPLCAATMSGNSTCVQELLEAGADPNACSDGQDGHNVLFHALNYYIHGLDEQHRTSFEDKYSTCTSTDNQSSMDLTGCLEQLLTGGAIVTGACLQMFVDSPWSLVEQPYHQMALMVLCALPYRRAEHMDMCRAIFCCLTDTKLMADSQQSCSSSRSNMHRLLLTLFAVGYMPLVKDLQRFTSSANNAANKDIQLIVEQSGFPLDSHHPRSLAQLSVATIRNGLSTNVLCSAGKLPLPNILKDCVTLSPSVINATFSN